VRAPLLIILILLAGCPRPVVEVQRRELGKEMPATLEAPTRFEGEVRTAKLQVWADGDYRAQNLRWERGFGAELDYANQLLEPMLGLRLEAEFHDWDRHDTTASIREAVDALAEVDDGADAGWVIGLTSALPLVSSSTDELGVAEVLGTYVVLRGYSDLAERKQFATAFPDLTDDEREEVHEARRLHKQTVLLIHELAHTLGAIHETDPSWIMHGAYSGAQASISDRNRELMLIALEDRLRPTEARDPLKTSEALRAALEASEWGGWIVEEREAMLVQLVADIDAMRAGLTAAPVPAAAYAQYQRAEQLGAGGQLDDALAELDPLLAAYPGNAAIRLLACKLRLGAAGPKDPEALDACGRAADLAPGDPAPYLAIAAALLAAGDPAGARAQLVEAEQRIVNLDTGGKEAWVGIAAMYQSMGAITWAEDAIAHAGAEQPIALWASQTRARYGVPRQGAAYKITPETEAELVKAVRDVLDLVYAGKLDDAGKRAKAAEKKWPGAPGLLAARCDLTMRKQDYAGAKKLCVKAIKEYAGSAWAHYLLGILSLRGKSDKDTEAGIASLREAIAADPDLGQAWRALGKALSRAGDQAGLDALKQSYADRFGTPLPD